MRTRDGTHLISENGILYWLDTKHRADRLPRKFYGASRPICEHGDCEQEAGAYLYCADHTPEMRAYPKDEKDEFVTAGKRLLEMANQTQPEAGGIDWTQVHHSNSNCLNEMVKAFVLLFDFFTLNRDAHVLRGGKMEQMVRLKISEISTMQRGYAMPEVLERYACWFSDNVEFPPHVAPL